MNIITFNKVITNYTKLERELRASSVYGSVYNFMSLKGSELNLHFTQNLTQAQIDAERRSRKTIISWRFKNTFHLSPNIWI